MMLSQVLEGPLLRAKTAQMDDEDYPHGLVYDVSRVESDTG